jgi:Domain of unknown function (DUF1844)
MAEREEQAVAFRVVDRRRFDDEGVAREGQLADAVKEVAKKPESAQISEAKVSVDPLNFSVFIQGLAHQTLMAMGLIPWPETGLVEARLEQAHETIDILSILQEKTKGNLSSEEKQLLDTLLYELRMAFVQALQKMNIA